jgi:hypothetical protein
MIAAPRVNVMDRTSTARPAVGDVIQAKSSKPFTARGQSSLRTAAGCFFAWGVLPRFLGRPAPRHANGGAYQHRALS